MICNPDAWRIVYGAYDCDDPETFDMCLVEFVLAYLTKKVIPNSPLKKCLFGSSCGLSVVIIPPGLN